MFHKVSVLFPYRSDHGPRARAFDWIKRYYRTAMPDIELCVGVHESGLFNRSYAINQAARKATRDIFVIADTDVIYDPSVLLDAIGQLKHHAWVVPFRDTILLSEENTRQLLQANPGWPFPVPVSNYSVDPGYETFVGRLNVIPRSNFYKVKGYDNRFVGWGREDDAFACSVNTLCGRLKKLEHKVYHLWHPYVGKQGNPHFDANTRIYEEYRRANGNPEAMRQLLQKRP